MKRHLDNAGRARLRIAVRKVDRVLKDHYDVMEQEVRELARCIGLELRWPATHPNSEQAGG